MLRIVASLLSCCGDDLLARILHETGAASAFKRLFKGAWRQILVASLWVQFAPARVLAGSCTPQHAMRPQPWLQPCFSVPSRAVTHLSGARSSRSRAIYELGPLYSTGEPGMGGESTASWIRGGACSAPRVPIPGWAVIAVP